MSENSSENDSDLENSNSITSDEADTVEDDRTPNGDKKSKEESLIDTAEWIKFNNQVISMRPAVKSATVQFIHRSTRTKNLLIKKKGTTEQVAKNNKKADRIVQEILYIKTLKKDVIAKFALLHSKEEVANIVNSATGTLEYKVKAKVASMAMVAKKAEVYHNNNHGWRETLYKLIQLAGKPMKRKRRKIRGKNKQSDGSEGTSKKSAQKKSKSGKEAKCDYDLDRFDDSHFPEPPPDLEDDSGSEEEEEEEEGISEERDVGSSNQRSSDESEIDTVQLIAPRKKTNPGKPAKKSTENVEKRQLDVSKKTETRFESMADSSSDVEEANTSNIDPFFMTSDNKEYKTLWKVEPADSFKHGKNREPEYMFKNAQPVGSKKLVAGRGGKAKLPRLSKRDQSNGKISKNDKTFVPVENLHPSWQAKKKLNISTAAFQGKKVVFDED